MTNTNEQAAGAGAAPKNPPCPFCSSTSAQTRAGKETRCNDCGNTFTEGQVVHASLSGVAAAASDGAFRCPVCCAPAGQPCAPGCTEATLASAVRKAIDMLAQVDVSKVPLAVPAAIGMLRCGLDAPGRTPSPVRLPWHAPIAPPDDDKLVLLELDDGEVWPGFSDCGTWRYVTSEPVDRERVVAWTDMPPGSRESAKLAAAAPAHLSAAAQDVLRERQRQVSVEGCDPAHDDEYPSGEIAAYAAFYAMPPAARDWPATETGYGDTFGEAILPADWSPPKTGDRRRELVKAGALILAEIERLDRLDADHRTSAQKEGEA